MSDAQHSAAEAHEAQGAHEGPIKSPKQLVVAVVAAFVVPIFVIALAINYVNFGSRHGAGSDSMSEEAVSRRLQPVGSIEFKDAAAAGALRNGETVFNEKCSACHASGALGAPKFGDAGAWGPRIGAGYAALLNSALKGKNAMPAQGGGDYQDVEIGAAVVYMANKGGAKFEEPKAPAAAASAPDAGASK